MCFSLFPSKLRKIFNSPFYRNQKRAAPQTRFKRLVIFFSFEWYIFFCEKNSGKQFSLFAFLPFSEEVRSDRSYLFVVFSVTDDPNEEIRISDCRDGNSLSDGFQKF
jgi:hypothetical protein